ncbi:metal ABC transporter permease [Streptococcus moroccensis]|uniref:Manganese/zinc/iron transport system permease protein n=1 Tax=Streptococcus moroccensis TaxID=1451356 RepID=A0ABT9YTY3_9STRE|nr:metal ABC transporter permease [Streptococcus moroccensis]MDQ0223456.1 manganese/zinc/iron transport system permease protein [Streptococcus moroccensis]
MSEVLLILGLVSVSTSLLGSLLVLQNQAMIADALSHSVLLGIVLGFFVSHSLESPLLVIGAAVFGVLTVVLIEMIQSRRLARDAATGLVFSTFFALAVLLISMFARNVHLDLDMVLMGEVLFAPFYRMAVFGLSLPVALVKSIAILGVNLLFLGSAYHPLKLMLFDPTQARLQGVPVKGLQLAVMVLVSLTTVVSFDAVGSIAVIALMIGPSMTALIWAKHLPQFFLSTLMIALLNSWLGFALANQMDLTMAGACAVVSLLTFLVALVGRRGLEKTFGDN